jgi:hypothetical protein
VDFVEHRCDHLMRKVSRQSQLPGADMINADKVEEYDMDMMDVEYMADFTQPLWKQDDLDSLVDAEGETDID